MNKLKQVENSDQQYDSRAEGDDAVIGRALIRSLCVIVPIIVVAVVILIWLNWPEPESEVKESTYVEAESRDTVTVALPGVHFTDVTKEAGINFARTTGAYGDKLLPETMGGGVAFLDFDNDGDQDILFVNSTYWPWEDSKDSKQPTMTLLSNDGTGRFEDVTAESGLDVSFYGMGVAVGDFDNDGWRDLFISSVFQNRLFRNENGVFQDVTESAGVGGAADAWSTSCGWFDYNNDGRLDLFVCNYVQWDKQTDLNLGSTLDGVNRSYGPPKDFGGTFPYLYRNDGNGRFTDISKEAGIQIRNSQTGLPASKSLGVVFVDFDSDGWQDIVVANDTVRNLLFHNQEGVRFEEIAATKAGIAFDGNGEATGAMGIDSARFRNDQSLGIVIGNFFNEPVSLYVARDGRAFFSDEALATGLGPQTRQPLTFGLFFFDFDLDGRLDVFVANGHLEDDINKTFDTQHYEQPPQLFWNAGWEQSTELVPLDPAQTGEDLHVPIAGRGTTFADIDNDGDLDVLITSAGGAPRLLRNDLDLGHHYLRVKLVGKTSSRDAIGARIIVRAGGQELTREIAPTRSYLSQVEIPVTFGLGKSNHVDELLVEWPDGTKQQVNVTKVDCAIEVRQGSDGLAP